MVRCQFCCCQFCSRGFQYCNRTMPLLPTFGGGGARQRLARQHCGGDRSRSPRRGVAVDLDSVMRRGGGAMQQLHGAMAAAPTPPTSTLRSSVPAYGEQPFRQHVSDLFLKNAFSGKNAQILFKKAKGAGAKLDNTNWTTYTYIYVLDKKE